MFENYSLSDFFANLYKKRLVYILIFLVMLLFLGGYIYKSLKNSGNKIIESKYNYSSYLSYKIIDNNSENVMLNNGSSGYGEFYSNLLRGNLNGAYLFSDISDEELKDLSYEIDTSVDVLKNSNQDFWDKKISVSTLSNNKGVTVSIITTSSKINDIIEKKFDSLIDSYKNTYNNVNINKVDTVKSNFKSNKSSQISDTLSSSSIVKKILLGVFLIVFLICAVNVAMYIFNPTINDRDKFLDYGIDFIYDVKDKNQLNSMLNYKLNNIEDTVFVGTNIKVLEKFKDIVNSDRLVLYTDIEKIINFNNVLVVEEYGITRIKNFESLLQNMKNLDKKLIGVISYRL